MFRRLEAECDTRPEMEQEEQRAFDNKFNKYRKKFLDYQLHKEQRKVCRAATQELDRNLKVFEAWIVRDYVNHHDHDGCHCKCLHWVVRYRDEFDHEPIKMLKTRNYCSDKSMATDLLYTVDVDNFHLLNSSKILPGMPKAGPGLLNEMKRIIFTSDKGSHFCSSRLFLHYCSYYRIYGKEFELLFYEAYHGEGRADGAGAQDKVQAVRNLRAGNCMFGAADFTRMTNALCDARSIAYEFGEINRSADILPDPKEVVSYQHYVKWCQIKFDYPGRTEKTEGVVLYRFVPNQGKGFCFHYLRVATCMVCFLGPWQWADLQKRREGEPVTCDICSTLKQQL